MQITIKGCAVEFTEEGHTYKHKETGELFTGVTTILEVRDKSWLTGWAVKMTSEYLKKNWKLNKKYTAEEKEQLLEESKGAWRKKSKDALDIGTIVHRWLDEYISKKNPELPPEEEAINSINSFLEWEKKHEIEWIISDTTVASELYQYAGRFDSVAMIDGKLTIVDFKTSNQHSETYNLQLAGYQLAWEEMVRVKLIECDREIEQRLVIRVPKDGSKCEPIFIQSDIEFDKETFLHLREIHRWNLYIKNNFEGNGKTLLK